MVSMMRWRVVGIVENMSYFQLASGERMEIFDSGGAGPVAETLTARPGFDVPVLGQVPLEDNLRKGGSSGEPILTTNRPDSEAAKILQGNADQLSSSRRLAGIKLGLTSSGRL